jgi:hypothetical protein
MFQKEKLYRNPKILEHAKGQSCTLNLPGCRYYTETTVFCHLNGIEWGKGIGIKAHDVGFFGCSSCHAKYDSTNDFDPDWLDLQVYRAVIKTVIILLNDGVIK